MPVNPHPSPLVIATRESRLALWQAEHVQALLRARGHTVSLLGMTTLGDQILDRSLSKVGGKGLFVKELETALQDGRAQLAVHSLKDVPMELPEGFALACVMQREDPRDAIRALVRQHDPVEGDGWAVRLAGLEETLMVSRRQVAALRESLDEPASRG